jgi:hypothetical protein
VPANGISDVSQYLRVQRTGRGTPLDRKTKERVWAIFAAYRAKLDQAALSEPEDAYRDAREILPRCRHSSPTGRSWSTRRRISERKRFGSSRRSLLGRATRRRRTACSSSATRISVAPSQRDPVIDSNHLRERRRAVI